MPTYDLSHSIESDMPDYPGTEPVSLEPTAAVAADGYRTTRLELDSHSGTHVDAPAHMLEDGRTLEEYPLETFRFAARVVDAGTPNPREPIGVAALEGGGYEDIDLLALRTGWDAHWGTDRYFDHPYLTADAAEFLVDRGVHLGVDALNVDPTPTANATSDEPDDYPAHHVLFGDDRLLLENLRGLDALPTGDLLEIHAYPLSIRDADGAPVRAVAVV